MQEQVPSNITPDHGWSQMKTILDREMPVSRRSRRGIFFWRSLMAVGLLATFAYLAWNNMQDVNSAEKKAPLQQEERIKPELPLKETPNPIDRAANDNSSHDPQPVATIDKAPEETAATPATPKANSYAKEKATTYAASSIAKSNTLPQEKTDQAVARENSFSLRFGEQAPVTENPSVVVIEQSGSTAEDSHITKSTDEIEIGNVQHIKSLANAMRNGQVVSLLPGLAIDQLFAGERDELDLAYIGSTPVIVQKTASKRVFAPYVSTHAMAGYSNGAAWQGGAGISIAALPKVRLSAGVSYRTYNPSFSITRLESDQSLGGPLSGESIVQADGQYPGIPNYIQEFSLNASTSYQSVEPLVKSIRQWQLDAGIAYDISKRWFLQTGIAYALQTSAYSAYPIIDDSFTADPSRVSVKHELEDYDVIRNGMISWSGGIGYHIGKRLDVSVETVHSFHPYLQPDPVPAANLPVSTERNDFIRGLSVGAKYRI